MEPVTPERFRAAFLRAIASLQPKLQVAWRRDWRSYTDFIRDRLLPTVSNDLKVKSYCRDYYTLDTVFFHEQDTTYFPKDKTYAKYIEVAIEHENDAKSSATEMNKLQLFNARLRVLIVYTREGEETENRIRCYNEIIAGADLFKEVAERRQQIVIFGKSERTDELPPSRPEDWRFYVYEQDGLGPMRP